jgi:hypothetical protein
MTRVPILLVSILLISLAAKVPPIIKEMNIDYNRSAIKLSEIKQQGIRDLEIVLESMQGEKILVLDEQIIGPLNLIASPVFLSKFQVSKIYKLSDQYFDVPLDSGKKQSIRNILYIVRPKILLMKWIASQVKYINNKDDCMLLFYSLV